MTRTRKLINQEDTIKYVPKRSGGSMYVTKKIRKLFIYESRIPVCVRTFLACRENFSFLEAFLQRLRAERQMPSVFPERKNKKIIAAGKRKTPADTRRGDIEHVLLGPPRGRVTRAALIISS